MMLSWNSKYSGKIETLQLKKDPFRYGLGHYEDIGGRVWDIACIFGGDKPYVNARLVTNIPYYGTSTSDHSNGFHKWKPFYLHIIK